MRAIVEEAHKADRLCSAHAVSTVSIKNAIRAGVDWVDHADFLDDEAIQMLLDTNTPIVPTQAIAWSLEHFGEDMGFGPHIATKAREVSQVATAALARAYQAGVRIVAGTDADNPRASLAQECQLLTEIGMSPLEAIHAATLDAAKLLRLGHLVGSLEAGKVADLLLVDGDAAKDIAALKRVKDVFQAGKRLELPLVDLRPFGYA
jgi:imidazolonepropionase-like amidohydrolase